MKKIIILLVLLLFMISSANAFLYYNSYNPQENKVYSYNYHKANENSPRYEKQFEYDKDNYYNVYNKRQGFRVNKGYSKPVTFDYDPNITNRFRVS